MGETISKSIASCTCADRPSEQPNRTDELDPTGQRLDRIEHILAQLADRAGPIPNPVPAANPVPNPVPRAEIPVEARR